MTNAFSYTTALWPDTHVILGHRLRPYTLGHALLLERLKSPFVTGAAAPGLGDLKLALALCKRPFPRALALAQPPFPFSPFPLFARLALRYTRCPARHFDRAARQFLAYLAAAYHHPKRWEKDGAPIGTPLLQQLKLTLMMDLRKTELQALCTPLALALWDAMGAWEMQGNLQLADEGLLEELDEFKRTMKDRLNGLPGSNQ